MLSVIFLSLPFIHFLSRELASFLSTPGNCEKDRQVGYDIEDGLEVKMAERGQEDLDAQRARARAEISRGLRDPSEIHTPSMHVSRPYGMEGKFSFSLIMLQLFAWPWYQRTLMS